MDSLTKFELLIAEYYGARHAIATDSCTHAIELALRLIGPKSTSCPTNTYLSIPFTFMKLNLDWHFDESPWAHWYQLGNTNILDAAVYWQEGGYVPGSIMCLSFQYKKHLSLGRGGMILLDDLSVANKLRPMVYDGRDFGKPWVDQNITTVGYHYYMTPETAQLGIDKFAAAVTEAAPARSSADYPDLRIMSVFK